ncbi:MAG: NAD(P)/FAD-dependent oxidoreductase [Dehalococcoidia bacterium]
MTYDVVVLGGGAAGLMCAIECGRRGRSVVVLERNEAVGKKILISGGGRCNFTNVHAEPEHYYSQNPDFCRSALAAYPPVQFISLVEQHGIAYHEKKLGQLFCDGSAREIVEMLLAECSDAGVEVVVNCNVAGVSRDSRFEIQTNQGAFTCESLVVATGGLSIPQLGATGLGYEIAEQSGVRRVGTRPGLVPLTFPKQELEFFQALAGVSLEVTASVGSNAFTENLLFTHRGLSGPAILQISNAWMPGEPISIDLSPRVALEEVLHAAKSQQRELVTVLGDILPKRFAQAWCAEFAPSRTMNRYSMKELEAIAEGLHHWVIRPAGTAGYGKAEVTLGGIDTRALNSKTMEAREVPGLYFIGEVVDVTGWLGGYNFQWAWASGFAAGQAA